MVSRSRAKVPKIGKAQVDQSDKMQSPSVCEGAGHASATKLGTLPIIASTMSDDNLHRFAQCLRRAAIVIPEA
jgi:hypothetical protein